MFISVKDDAKAYIWIQGSKLPSLGSKIRNFVKPALRLLTIRNEILKKGAVSVVCSESFLVHNLI